MERTYSLGRTTFVLPKPLRDKFNQLKNTAGFQSSTLFLGYLLDLYTTLRGFGGFRSLDGVGQLVKRSTANPSFFEHDSRARVIVGKLLLARTSEKEEAKNYRAARIEVNKEVCVRFSRLARTAQLPGQKGFKKNADFLAYLLDAFSPLSELARGRPPSCVQEDLQYLAFHISQAEKGAGSNFS